MVTDGSGGIAGQCASREWRDAKIFDSALCDPQSGKVDGTPLDAVPFRTRFNLVHGKGDLARVDTSEGDLLIRGRAVDIHFYFFYFFFLFPFFLAGSERGT